MAATKKATPKASTKKGKPTTAPKAVSPDRIPAGATVIPDHKYDEVVERCREMMKRFENDRHVFTRSDSLWMISIIWSAGNGLRYQSKETEAIGCFENALANRAYERLNKWRLFWSLGDLYRDQRRIHEAREAYYKALAIVPEKYKKNIQKDLDNLPSMP